MSRAGLEQGQAGALWFPLGLAVTWGKLFVKIHQQMGGLTKQVLSARWNSIQP